MTIPKISVLSDKSCAYLLIRGIAFFWFITKIFSYKTWIASRKFPVIAPSEYLRDIPSEIHWMLFVVSMLMLFMIVISPKKYLLILFLIFEFLSCSLDTVRWQPWEFMYFVIFTLYFFNFKKQKSFFLLVHLFVASVYIFSGLHKFNRGFLSNVWTQMILQSFFNLSSEAILTYKMFFMGLIIPVTEFFAGLLLILSKHKKQISYFLISVHIFVLLIIGPFGLNYNPVVWSWNLAMIFLLTVIYLKPVKQIEMIFIKQNAVWVILWFVMPFLSFYSMWYQYFSSGLYTGKEKQLYIYVSKQNNNYKEFSDSSDLNLNQKFYIVNLQNWALAEIKSVPLPEDEIYRKISIYLKEKLGKDCQKIILYDPQSRKLIRL